MTKPDPSFDVELYWRVLRRRGWLLAIPVVLLTAILGLGSLLLPSIYFTQAQVVVRQEQDPLKGLAVETQITQQLGGVIQSLKRPSLQKAIFERLEASRPPGLTLENALTDYRDHLRIDSRKVDNDLIVDFLYTGTPEKYAVDVVNAFAEQFQADGTTLVDSSLTTSLDFVDEQLQQYRVRLKKLDEEELRLQGQLAKDLPEVGPATVTEGLDKVIADRLAADRAEIEKLNLEIDSQQAQVTFLRTQLERTKRTLALRSGEGAGAAQAELERLLGEARARRVALLTRYTESHPDIIALGEQIRELERRRQELAAGADAPTTDISNPQYESLERDLFTADAALQAMRARRAQLTERSDRLAKAAARLRGILEELRRIQSERAALSSTYEGLLARKQNLELNQSFESGRNTGRFEVRRAGGVPLKPIRPNRRKIAVLGFLAGLFIGISFVLLAEYLDHSVRSPEDLRRYIDAPILAVLPRAPR